MLGKKDEWEEVRYGADNKPRTEFGRSRWSNRNNIGYGGGCAGATQSGQAGFRGNSKYAGVVFNVQGNAFKMMVQFKMNVERCSKYAGRKFKDDPAGAAAAIRTRTAPSILEPKKPKKGSRKVDIIIWKDDYLKYKRKEKIWAQTNPIIFNMVLG